MLFLYLSLRREFGIVKKLEEKPSSKNVQNECVSQKLISINNEKLPTPETENAQNKFNCSHTSCNCPRCKNMNGN